MLNREANTQYNDWTGGAAFDDGDFEELSNYALSAGYIQSNDVIYSFEASYSHLSGEMSVTISYTNMNYDDFKGSGASLSTKEFDLPVADFYKLFKRAHLAVAKKGL